MTIPDLKAPSKRRKKKTQINLGIWPKVIYYILLLAGAWYVFDQAMDMLNSRSKAP